VEKSGTDRGGEKKKKKSRFFTSMRKGGLLLESEEKKKKKGWGDRPRLAERKIQTKALHKLAGRKRKKKRRGPLLSLPDRMKRGESPLSKSKKKRRERGGLRRRGIEEGLARTAWGKRRLKKKVRPASQGEKGESSICLTLILGRDRNELSAKTRRGGGG